MNSLSTETSTCADRREAPRHYLTWPMRAELVYGGHRMLVGSGSICNISKVGIGLRSSGQAKIAPGTPFTIAISRNDQVVTLTGKVAAVRQGVDIGIQLGSSAANPLLDMLDENLESAVVTPPQHGVARLSGTVSMAARHPIRWAIQAGARRVNLAAVTALDSSGIGMLLQFHDRDGLTIERCPPHVCRLIKLCGTAALCSAECLGT